MNKLFWVFAVLAALAGVAYGGVVAFVAAIEGDLVYRPDRTPFDPARLKTEGFELLPIETPTGGLNALVLRRPQRDTTPLTVVYFHDGATSAMRVLPKFEPLLFAGWGVALVEYPGYGDVPGTPSEESIYGIARRAVVEAARATGGFESLVLWGTGLGAAVVARIATEQAFAGIVLEAPFTSVSEIAQPLYPWLPLRDLLNERYDVLARIDALNAPLLLGHGERDAVNPVAMGRRLFAAAKDPKRGVFYPNGGHDNLIEWGFVDEVAAFLIELRQARARR